MSPIGSVDISSFIRNPEMLSGSNNAADAASLAKDLGAAAQGASAGAAGALGASGTVGGQPASFSSMLENAVQDVNSTMQTAETEKAKVLTGETSNVHQAMIAVQESSVAFSLMVEVRNKLVDSYQELMRMQV